MKSFPSPQEKAQQALRQVTDLKALNEEVLDLLEKEKQQNEKHKKLLMDTKNELSTEKGSHTYTLQQLDEEREKVHKSNQILMNLKKDMANLKAQLDNTIKAESEKSLKLQEQISNLTKEKSSLEEKLNKEIKNYEDLKRRFLQEQEKANTSKEMVDKLTKHIREIKTRSSPNGSPQRNSLRERELERKYELEREEHEKTKKALEDERKMKDTADTDALRHKVYFLGTSLLFSVFLIISLFVFRFPLYSSFMTRNKL